MHQALAAERDEVRLRVTPMRQCRRPLPRPAQIQHFLAGLDHAAIDEPGDERREAASGDGDHGLVEQCHPARTVPVQHGGLPRPEPSEYGQIDVPVTGVGGVPVSGVAAVVRDAALGWSNPAFYTMASASIGLQMDLKTLFDADGAWLLLLGAIWMSVHVLVILAAVKLVRAPLFYLGVGSQGNIGAAARAMKTMGISDLAIVAPREPRFMDHPQARALASGAVDLLAQARSFATLSLSLQRKFWPQALFGRSASRH